MSKQIENLLQQILDELLLIRLHIVPPPVPTKEELARDITVALGVGPDNAFNK